MTPAFAAHYAALRDEARRLKRTLPQDAYRRHERVKLAASVHDLVTNLVPQDPNRRDFLLKGPLAKFRRAKGHGLPPRYRLFWVYSQQARTIIFLYLNDETTLRTEGGRNDPYHLFQRMLERGEVGKDFQANYAAWLRAQSRSGGAAPDRSDSREGA